MTKEAIRKREYRAKLPDEKKNANKVENAERSKLWRMSGTPEEIETRKRVIYYGKFQLQALCSQNHFLSPADNFEYHLVDIMYYAYTRWHFDKGKRKA